MSDTYPIRQWLNAFKQPAPRVGLELVRLHGDSTQSEASLQMYRQVLELAAQVLGEEAPVSMVRSPARINLLGTHIDHRGGAVNPLAAKEMVFVVGARADHLLRLFNLEPGKYRSTEFHILEELPSKKVEDWEAWTRQQTLERQKAGAAGDWSNYVKAAVLYLQELSRSSNGSYLKKLKGMDLFVGSNIPTAASLSSSSALVVASALAARHVNQLEYSHQELVELCGIAEWYVGTRGGAGDHAAILLGRAGKLMHVEFFPLRVSLMDFPSDYKVLLCNTLKEAKKQTDAKNIFNSRVAGYQIGFMIIKKHFPEYAPMLERLRDINPEHLGVEQGRIYEMLLTLPQSASRAELAGLLPEKQEELEAIYQTHDEPAGGYKLRQVCLYGISECIRSHLGAKMFRAGDIAGFGKLMNLSHQGDRIVRFRTGKRTPVDHSVPDEKVRELIMGLQSADPDTVKRSQLYQQPGGYQVSCEELDELVDICLDFPGVVGAGLVGAGLGGCMAAIVEAPRAEELVEEVSRKYYSPREVGPACEVCNPVEGAGLLTI